MRSEPTPGALDRALLASGYPGIVGLDEVGRGALAGPVVVCAVRFTAIPRIDGVRDSKLVARQHRADLVRTIKSRAQGWAVVEVWPDVIDRINILQSVRIAMRSLIAGLAVQGDVVVCDAVKPFDGPIPIRVESPTKADRDYFSVASASLIAKVNRDRTMAALRVGDQDWGWERNSGYSTLQHRRVVGGNGRSYLHRESFHVGPVIP